MIAYKGFNSNLAARLGRGIFHYEVGKTYKEKECKTAAKGFHCVEEPLECLRWYSQKGDRYCIVKADGDINEDDFKRISCTEITILKEITKLELAIYECMWIEEHPERSTSSHIQNDEGIAHSGFAIVRGKKPIAKGVKGDTLFLVQEYAKSKKIKKIVALEVDGIDIKENTYYGTNEKEVV